MTLAEIADVAAVVVGVFLLGCAYVVRGRGERIVLALSAVLMIGSTVLSLGGSREPVGSHQPK